MRYRSYDMGANIANMSIANISILLVSTVANAICHHLIPKSTMLF